MGKIYNGIRPGNYQFQMYFYLIKRAICAVLPRRSKNNIIRKPGWVEHDPRKSGPPRFPWLLSHEGKIGVDAEDIHAIGITNQRETTIVWDKKTGEPVYPAIVWQCRRTADMIEKMEKTVCQSWCERNRFDSRCLFFRNQTEMDPGSCRRCKRTCPKWRTAFWNCGYLADLEADKGKGTCD